MSKLSVSKLSVSKLSATGERFRNAYVWLEDKPMVVAIAAGGATAGVVVVLASSAGWPHVSRLATEPHAWGWILVCLAGELAAYGGYILTVRDMARVDGGSGMTFRLSTQAVVAGFGVFAATRSSGGFAVDYWAFRRAGAGKREAVSRTLALGLLEYVVLSVGALGASVALFFRWDGHASDAVTLPSLLIIPSLAFGWWITSPARAKRLTRKRSSWWRRMVSDTVSGGTTLRELLISPREHGFGVLGNAIYWAGDILCLWAALRLVNAHIPVAALVLGYSGGYVLTRRALPAGGAGVVELALTFALVGMGMHFVPALVGVVVYRLFNFWLPILPALLLMPAVKSLRERFQRAERTA